MSEPKICSLRIKEEFIDLIASGKKTDEYRKIDEYYIKRFVMPDRKTCKHFDILHLFVGNKVGAKELKAEITYFHHVIFSEKHKPPPGAKIGDRAFKISIGKIISKNF